MLVGKGDVPLLLLLLRLLPALLCLLPWLLQRRHRPCTLPKRRSRRGARLAPGAFPAAAAASAGLLRQGRAPSAAGARPAGPLLHRPGALLRAPGLLPWRLRLLLRLPLRLLRRLPLRLLRRLLLLLLLQLPRGRPLRGLDWLTLPVPSRQLLRVLRVLRML
jgi:hypothetical protein